MTSSGAYGIQPLSDFLRSVETAQYASYAALPQARVRDTVAFEEMRAHILSRYADVGVVHSFTDSAGQVFDCIPAEQQSGWRPSRLQPRVSSHIHLTAPVSLTTRPGCPR